MELTKTFKKEYKQVIRKIKEFDTIIIHRHVRPDGDCVGSCMALYLYIRKIYPEKEV